MVTIVKFKSGLYGIRRTVPGIAADCEQHLFLCIYGTNAGTWITEEQLALAAGMRAAVEDTLGNVEEVLRKTSYVDLGEEVSSAELLQLIQKTVSA